MSSSLAMMKKQLSKYNKIQDSIQGSSNNKENSNIYDDLPIQINTYHSIPNSSYNSRQKQQNESNILQSYQTDNMIKVSNDFLKQLLEKQTKQEKKQVDQEQQSKEFYQSTLNSQSFVSISNQNFEQRPISSSSKIQNNGRNTYQNNRMKRAQSNEKQRPSTSHQPQQNIMNNYNQTDQCQPAAQIISYSPFVRKTFSTTIYKNSNINTQGNINQNKGNSISPNSKQSQQIGQQQNNYIIKLQKSFDKQGNKIVIVPRRDSGIKSAAKIIRSQSKHRVTPNQTMYQNMITNTEPSENIFDNSFNNTTNNSFLQISKYNHRQFESGLCEEKYALQVKKSREDFSQITRCQRTESADLKSSNRKKRNVSLNYMNSAQKQKNQDNQGISYLKNKGNNIIFNTPITQKRQRLTNQEITPWDNHQVSQSDILSDVFNQSPKNQFSPIKNSFLFNSNSLSQNFQRQMIEQKLINLHKSVTNPLEQIQQFSQKKDTQNYRIKTDIDNPIVQTPKKVSTQQTQQQTNSSKIKTPVSNKKSVPMRKISERIEDTQQKETDILPLTNYNDVITSKNIFRPLRPISKNSKREKSFINNQNQQQQQQQKKVSPFKKPKYRCDKGLPKNHRIFSLNGILQAFRNIPFIRDYLLAPQVSNVFIPTMQKLYDQLDQHQEPSFMNTLTQFFQSFLTSQQNRGDNEMNEVEILINIVIEQLLYNAIPQKQNHTRLTRLANFSQNDEDACDLFEELAFTHQNNEVFFNLFGLLKYNFQCSECMNADSNLEDFYIFKTLKMEINRFQTDFINNMYTTGKAEANYCDYCMKDKLFYQKMEFIQLPKLLIIPIQINIDQFYSNVNSYTSKNVFNQLDIPQDFVITDIYKNKNCYKLIGEIDKIGNSSQYISIFRDRKGYIQSYSDIKVKFLENFPLESAQVLFYIKTDQDLSPQF